MTINPKAPRTIRKILIAVAATGWLQFATQFTWAEDKAHHLQRCPQRDLDSRLQRWRLWHWRLQIQLEDKNISLLVWVEMYIVNIHQKRDNGVM